MIVFDNNEITAMTYSGHNIVRVYGCGGELVFGSAPSPTANFKASGTSIYGDYVVQCNDMEELHPHELPSASGITTLVVGNCTTVLGYGAFNQGKTAMTLAEISSTVDLIMDFTMFQGDTNMQTLIVRAIIPPRFYQYDESQYPDDNFFGINGAPIPVGFKIYVPNESLNAYKTADGWKRMADYIYPII